MPEAQPSSYHVPVLLHEAVDALDIRPDGIYVDCTFGGGGHAREIMSRLNENGRLFAFDQDPDAQANLTADTRLTFIPHNFRHLSRFMRLEGVAQVDGILADLGVSSHQFDEPTRDFPFDSMLRWICAWIPPLVKRLQHGWPRHLPNRFSGFSRNMAK